MRRQCAKVEPGITEMKIAIKIWFCLAVATIAASVSDFIVETASDRGWFGPGDFSDHSSWVTGPALLVGLIFIALHLVLRVRASLFPAHNSSQNWLVVARQALGRKVLAWTPVIFAVQLLALFAMENIEQFVVYGHLFGGTVWLDGPVIYSVAIHAAFCVVVTWIAAKSVRALADATVQFVKFVLSFATLRERGIESQYLPYRRTASFGQSIRALRCIGERAPPLLVS